jgi:hypothetical protein
MPRIGRRSPVDDLADEGKRPVARLGHLARAAAKLGIF